jgi:hypothetical protein
LLKVALVGLFSPMAAAASLGEACFDPAHELPGLAGAVTPGMEPPRAFEAEALFSRTGAASAGFWVADVRGWLQAHSLALDNLPRFQGQGRMLGQDPLRPKLHGGLLAHSLTYKFMSCPLPERWQGALGMTRLKLEASVDRNAVRLSLRIGVR